MFRLISCFIAFYKKRQLKHLKNILRGYRSLSKDGRLNIFSAIKQDLTLCKIDLSRQHSTEFFFGSTINSPDLVLCQFLLSRIGNTNFNKALLFSLRKGSNGVVYHMPLEWREIVEKYGFKVNHSLSEIYWKIYCFYHFINGLSQIAKVICGGIWSIVNKEKSPENYIYFANLNCTNLPQTKKNNMQSYDIISWYLQWPGRKKDINTILHGVKDIATQLKDGVTISHYKKEVPAISSFGGLLKYSLWAVEVVFISFYDLLLSRCYNSLILSEAAKRQQAQQAIVAGKSFFAKSYLFHMSDWCYRPMWTYEVEKHGSSVIFYFYATNCEGINKKKSNKSISYGYKSMSWTNYLVWDEYQASYIRNCVGDKAKISVVGPIWFSEESSDYPLLPEKSILVFDVQPMRDSIYKTLGLEFEYYIPSIANQFLLDISEVIGLYKYNMVLKRKREIASAIHPSYRNNLERLKNLSNFVEVSPSFSATGLIKNSMAVISMPFTSTAHIAKNEGVPSIYYDPSGALEKDDPAAHGIDILSNKSELTKWVKLLLKNN